MTDYILVTLQNDMGESELKEYCKNDLIEFFGDKTTPFVDTLFEALRNKQYLPSRSSESSSRGHQQSRSSRDHSAEGRSSHNGRESSSHRRRSRSPGRDRHRHSERRGRSSRSRSPAERRSAREHRSLAGVDMDLLNGPLQPESKTNNRQQQQQQNQSRQQQMLSQAQQQQPMAPIFTQQLSQQAMLQQPQQQLPKRTRACFEYLRKGTCQRGDTCTYAHVTPEQAQAMGMQLPPNLVPGGAVGNQVPGNVPFMAPGAHPYMLGQQQPGFFPMQARPPHMRPQIPQQQQHQQHGDSQATSPTAIFVMNIPDENMTEASVREFFGKFGEITDVRLDYAKHSAVVDFANPASQYQAISAPDAVFNNRFVRVYKAHQQRTGQTAAGQAAVAEQPAQPPVWRPKSAALKMAEQIEKYVEQQKELMKKLTTTKDMSPQTRKIIMDSITQIQKKMDDLRKPKVEKPVEPQDSVPAAAGAVAPATAGAGAGAEEQSDGSAVASGNLQLEAVESEKLALQNKLKVLQEQAARLGLAQGAQGARGGFRGGFRGGMRGGHAAASRGSMSLDKRPRTLVLRNLNQEAVERLGSEMAQFGEVEVIDKTDSGNEPPFTYSVKYKARWEAENAMKNIAALDSFSDVQVEWDQ
ncbi:hypothetical protein GGI07_002178 [Coemansia sp. Benny D115]|nr:hypothetical protein GGI07_002178 [Coemansia sp. Benny D115]